MSQELNKEMVSVVPWRNKKIGLGFLLGPFVGIFLVLVFYSITIAVVHNRVSLQTHQSASTGTIATGIILQEPSMGTQTLRLVNGGLGILGLLSVIGIFVGIPLGIYFLQKKKMVDAALYDPRSGKGDQSVVPPEIKKWNFAALVFALPWGIYHNLWISLLTLIPFLNLALAVYLSFRGNELAWRKSPWESVAAFQWSQKRWTILAVILCVFSFFMTIFLSLV